MKHALIAIFATIISSSAFADDPAKKLTALDLSVQTHKWDGKSIQTTARCFYADKADYRCAIGAAGTVFVRVDFQDVEPAQQKDFIENQCDTVVKLASKPCVFQITFVYDSNHWDEKSDGGVVMLISAKDGLGTLGKSGR